MSAVEKVITGPVKHLFGAHLTTVDAQGHLIFRLRSRGRRRKAGVLASTLIPAKPGSSAPPALTGLTSALEKLEWPVGVYDLTLPVRLEKKP
jgi:hypothetical protein